MPSGKSWKFLGNTCGCFDDIVESLISFFVRVGAGAGGPTQRRRVVKNRVVMGEVGVCTCVRIELFVLAFFFAGTIRSGVFSSQFHSNLCVKLAICPLNIELSGSKQGPIRAQKGQKW